MVDRGGNFQRPVLPHAIDAAPPHRGFGQLFGLDPRIAFLMFVVDMMLFGGNVLTMGLLLPVSIGSGLVLAFVTYRAQRRWFGDDHDAALIKAAIVGLLTAIPTPLPAVIYVPSGILGFITRLRSRAQG
jgi:hypothetical protein